MRALLFLAFGAARDRYVRSARHRREDVGPANGPSEQGTESGHRGTHARHLQTDASKGLGMFDALNGSEDAAALAHRSPLFSQPQEKDVFIFIHNSKHLIPLNPNPSDNKTGHIVAPQKMACGCDESFHLA